VSTNPTNAKTKSGFAQIWKQNPELCQEVSQRKSPPCHPPPHTSRKTLVWGFGHCTPSPRAVHSAQAGHIPGTGGGGAVARLTALRRPPPPLGNQISVLRNKLVALNALLEIWLASLETSCKAAMRLGQQHKGQAGSDRKRETHQLFLHSDSTPFRNAGRDK